MRKAVLTRGDAPKERLRVRCYVVSAGRSIAGRHPFPLKGRDLRTPPGGVNVRDTVMGAARLSRRVAHVVVLRAANVGGRNVFRPSVLALELTRFGVVSIGAAGTFVAHASRSSSELAAAVAAAAPPGALAIVLPAHEVAALVARDPFAAADPALGRFVTVLADRPRAWPALPVEWPTGRAWQVRVVEAGGRFVLSVRRRVAGRAVYPNEVVEREVGVRATTRGWDTMLAVAEAIRGK